MKPYPGPWARACWPREFHQCASRCKPPELPRGAMAEHGVNPARKHGCLPAPPPVDPSVPDAKDASMNGVQRTSLQSQVHCTATNPHGQELPSRNNAVLPRSQLGEIPINTSIRMPRAAFATYAVVNAAFVWHTRQVGGRPRTSGAPRVNYVWRKQNEAPARRYRLWL